MRLLVCAPTFPPLADGVSHVAYRHAQLLARQGHDVTVATARVAGRKPIAGVAVVEFDVGGNANPRTRYRGEKQRYIDYVASFRGDAIFCHAWQIWSTDLAVRGFRSTAAKKILVSHGVSANNKAEWPRTIPNYLLWRPYVWSEMPRILWSFDRLVVLADCSDRDRFYDRWLADRLGYQNISVIPNGADLDGIGRARGDFRERFGLRRGSIVLSVGKFSRGKNERAIVRAFQDADVDASTLVLIGPAENAYSRELEAMWCERRSRGSLRVLAGLSQHDIASAYKAANVFAMASRTEYFPLVILDAMAAGVPFVSTNVGCVRDLPGGVVVAREADLAPAMRRLLVDPVAATALGAAGRRACETRHSWQHVSDQLGALLNRVAA